MEDWQIAFLFMVLIIGAAFGVMKFYLATKNPPKPVDNLNKGVEFNSIGNSRADGYRVIDTNRPPTR